MFCKASGQKLNFGKSAMLSSSNVHEMEAKRLSELLAISLTVKLGKYLGHHVRHHGRDGEGHRELVERVKDKLDGWKVCCLSRAGKFTLAKSAMSSLPIF